MVTPVDTKQQMVKNYSIFYRINANDCHGLILDSRINPKVKKQLDSTGIYTVF